MRPYIARPFDWISGIAATPAARPVRRGLLSRWLGLLLPLALVALLADGALAAAPVRAAAQPGDAVAQSREAALVANACRRMSPRRIAPHRPNVRRPAVKRPRVKRPTFDRPSVSRPAVNRPSVRRPAVHRPSYDRPTPRRPIVRTPGTNSFHY